VPVVRSLAVIDAPTEVAETAAGAVGYREIGTGSPIVLIMGLGGSMDDWQPSFVAVLATSHKVVMLDNAGVGQTASLVSPLSAPAMANQTSALMYSGTVATDWEQLCVGAPLNGSSGTCVHGSTYRRRWGRPRSGWRCTACTRSRTRWPQRRSLCGVGSPSRPWALHWR
jgi:hypothetical protein